MPYEIDILIKKQRDYRIFFYLAIYRGDINDLTMF